MLNEKKGTCCHKCGHVHVKGTKCPSPFLKGERSCARRSLKEAEETSHYRDRKKERGIIVDIEIPDAAYQGRSAEEVKAKLLPILQAKLDQRLKYVEAMDLGMSNNINLGLVVFTPVLMRGEKPTPIKMVSENGQGHYYLVIATNGKLLTIYPGSKKLAELEKDVEQHVKRVRPDDSKPSKVDVLSGHVFKIDLDGNEVKDAEKKPEAQRASEDTLTYKVRTDYRLGATFNHEQFGTGKIVAAAGGGKAGTNGVVDWIEVKYDKPFLKGGKLQDTRRFENVLTAAYFGKTLKKELHTVDHDASDEHHQVRADVEEMSLENPSAKDFIDYLKSDLQHLNSFAITYDFPVKEDPKDTLKHIEDYIGSIDYSDPDWKDFQSWRNTQLDEYNEYCPSCLAEYLLEYENKLEEAEYRGRKVQLGKPFLTPGGPKKRSVYVKNAKGNVVKVNFGDPNLKIKKNIPARRKAFRARHKCDNPGPRWKARYWSCKAW